MEVEIVFFNIKDEIEQDLSEQPLLRLSKYRDDLVMILTIFEYLFGAVGGQSGS